MDKKATEVLKVIGLARANNVAIMLTQFTDFKHAANIRSALLSCAPLSVERLGLLCQVYPDQSHTFHVICPKAAHGCIPCSRQCERLLLSGYKR